MRIEELRCRIELVAVRQDPECWPAVRSGPLTVIPDQLLIEFRVSGPRPDPRAVEVCGRRRYASGRTVPLQLPVRFVGPEIPDELLPVVVRAWHQVTGQPDAGTRLALVAGRAL